LLSDGRSTQDHVRRELKERYRSRNPVVIQSKEAVSSSIVPEREARINRKADADGGALPPKAGFSFSVASSRPLCS
jgi:hypothetical protein